MDWPNVGRHELGATSVLRPKALEFAREIEQKYPHLGEISARHSRVEPDATDLVEDMATCDLIVSTMGNWAAESYLNDLQQDHTDFPPIIYGWVEPNAAAAHAVLIPRNGACFRCGVDDKGRPDLVVTSWNEGTDVLQEPACGALFTPYGPAELCWAHALLAESVVDALMANIHSAKHRAWIGRRTLIETAGGSWSEEWSAAVGNPGDGGMTVERTWAASAQCPACARQVYAV
ncbi:ThiF family adenylyltransferase [Fodinicurvata halophila]|uniref:ThiF family adenylyltransferase n=1 Tax=Fodinicurvata halophila TaxID=1419723 RepID=A0ABV8UNL4_9PROT